MDIQWKKGVLEYCLLHQIAQKETYGYDLLRILSSAFPTIQEGTIYAILRRLKSNGMAEIYEGKESGGPVRKYYRITPRGRESLEQMRQDWQDLVRGVTLLCGDVPEKFSDPIV